MVNCTITIPQSMEVLLHSKGINDIEAFIIELLYKYIEEHQDLNNEEKILIEENLKGLGYL